MKKEYFVEISTNPSVSFFDLTDYKSYYQNKN